MKKYIDADLLKSDLEALNESDRLFYMGVFDVINSQPAADVVEVQHGEWIEKEHWIPLPRDYEVPYDSDYDDCYNEKTHSRKEKYWHCSCCSYEASRDTKSAHKYCPLCGAKMDKEQERNA